MKLETKRLIMRPWEITDAESLFEYAKDPDIGPMAGWPAHKSIEESRVSIVNVLSAPECYAICEKGTDKAIGAISLKLNGNNDLTKRDDECEMGFWMGKPFWGRGYMPEAAEELLRHGFEDLRMTTVWVGYYDGNEKSKRVQEKLGFQYHHTNKGILLKLLNVLRDEVINYMTKEMWLKTRKLQ